MPKGILTILSILPLAILLILFSFFIMRIKRILHIMFLPFPIAWYMQNLLLLRVFHEVKKSHTPLEF